jgi:predicted nuclease with RNAse H fold
MKDHDFKIAMLVERVQYSHLKAGIVKVSRHTSVAAIAAQTGVMYRMGSGIKPQSPGALEILFFKIAIADKLLTWRECLCM